MASIDWGSSDVHSTWVREFNDILPTISWDAPHPVIHIWGISLEFHYYQGGLEVPEVPNMVFEDKLMEMDLELLRDTNMDLAK